MPRSAQWPRSTAAAEPALSAALAARRSRRLQCAVGRHQSRLPYSSQAGGWRVQQSTNRPTWRPFIGAPAIQRNKKVYRRKKVECVLERPHADGLRLCLTSRPKYCFVIWWFGGGLIFNFLQKVWNLTIMPDHVGWSNWRILRGHSVREPKGCTTLWAARSAARNRQKFYFLGRRNFVWPVNGDSGNNRSSRQVQLPEFASFHLRVDRRWMRAKHWPPVRSSSAQISRLVSKLELKQKCRWCASRYKLGSFWHWLHTLRPIADSVKFEYFTQFFWHHGRLAKKMKRVFEPTETLFSSKYFSSCLVAVIVWFQ